MTPNPPAQTLASDRCGSPRACAALPALAAAAMALLVYAITLGGSYVYDDTIIQEDPRFTHPALWKEFWTNAYMPGAVDNLYRPLTCITLAIEYSVHGDRPWAFHLVNWLLHAAAAAAVAELARRLMGFRAALAAGVLFAVHPVHVEAVAGLVGRAEMLSTLAILGAAVLFLKPMTALRSAAIAGCLIVAILSKEQGILLPAIVLTLVPFRRKLQLAQKRSTARDAASQRGAMLGLAAALCLIMATYVSFREQLLGFGWDRNLLDWEANPLIRSTGAERVLMPLVLLGRYVVLMIAPVHLSLDYGSHVIGWAVNWGQPYVYIGAATAGAWLATTIWALRKRQSAVLFCLLALGLSYGMVSNAVILIGTIFGERLMYLPSVFCLILVAALLAHFLRPALFTAAVALLVILSAIGSITYARLWNDPLELYTVDLAAHPESMHLHGLVVHQHLLRREFLDARRVAEDCIREVPDSWHAYQMCVSADLHLHDFVHADSVLRSAHPYPPDSIMHIRELRRIVRDRRMQYPVILIVTMGAGGI